MRCSSHGSENVNRELSNNRPRLPEASVCPHGTRTNGVGCYFPATNFTAITSPPIFGTSVVVAGGLYELLTRSTA